MVYKKIMSDNIVKLSCHNIKCVFIADLIINNTKKTFKNFLKSAYIIACYKAFFKYV